MNETPSCPTPSRRGYPTRAAAERRRPLPTANRGARSFIFPYKCRCGMWHLGNQREPQGPRRDCHTPDKVGFATQDAAERRAANLSSMRGVGITTYLCKCGWWHLTSR